MTSTQPITNPFGLPENRLLILSTPVVLFLALLTLPIYETHLLPGIDPPLQWVYDHLFISDFELARDLRFPHGPLAFFMYPLKDTLFIVVLTTLLLKLYIGYLVLTTHIGKTWKEWFLAFVILYLLYIASQFNQLLIISVLLSYQRFWKSKKWVHLFAGLLLTAVAIYVKSYVGIITGVISATYFIFLGYQSKSIKAMIIPGLTLSLLYFTIWVIMFNSVNGFIDYFLGVIQLAGDNSSAAAYYPTNNWLYLIVYILLIGALIWINRKNDNKMISIVAVPAIFAGWKHGMAREDLAHYHGLFTLTILIVGILILTSKQTRFLNMAVGFGCVALLNLNGTQLDNYLKPSYNAASFSRITQFWQAQEKDQIAHHVFSNEIKTLIGNHTVDSYPWDYSIIAANNFKWQPRPVLHAYASYTPWLDSINAQHFKSEKAPDFLIWELNKITTDLNGGNFESIDNRYLLNNEPKTLEALLQRYKTVKKENGCLILTKRNQPVNINRKRTLEGKGSLNKWISLPSHGKTTLLKFLPLFNKSITQGLKSFFYKDEQYWILLKTNNGSFYKYRFVPKNAENGLWINPFLVHDGSEDLVVTEVAIVASNQTILNSDFTYQWEELSFSDENTINEFFGRKDYYFKSWPFYFYEQNYSDHTSEWSMPINVTRDKKELVGEFSSTLSLSLDSIPKKNIIVRSTLDLWTSNYNLDETQLVIEVKNNETTYRTTEHIKNQVLNSGDQNVIVGSLKLESIPEGATLTVYLFNPKRHNIEIDNFKVELIHY